MDLWSSYEQKMGDLLDTSQTTRGPASVDYTLLGSSTLISLKSSVQFPCSFVCLFFHRLNMEIIMYTNFVYRLSSSFSVLIDKSKIYLNVNMFQCQ